MLELVAAASLCAWLVLLLAHGRFWQADQRLSGAEPEPPRWPAVAAVIPARNEADLVAETVAAVLAQDYPGELRVFLVDDESEDLTGEVAAAAARSLQAGSRFELVRTKPRPEGWVGKVWALHTGVSHASRVWPEAELFWFSDADVLPAPRTLRRLVAKLQAERLALVSLMVKLHCESAAERLLIPAFVYFFQKLYPFPRVNDPRSRTAAAAGGCVVVRADALARAGGIEAIRGEVIDDCALGRRVKSVGPIWLGLGVDETSVRPYPGVPAVWDMVARSAYTQLGHSPLVLAGTLAALLLLYAAPPLLALLAPLHGSAGAAGLGLAAWIATTATFVPTLTLYGRSPWLAFALPVAGVLYAGMTLDSARRHRAGQGAHWKGRSGAGAAGIGQP